MGNEDGRRDEKPVTQVCIDYTFWIDRTEVTNQAFGQPGNATGDLQPRENLTWFEARDFCTARGSRLPTEAEWEYAARENGNMPLEAQMDWFIRGAMNSLMICSSSSVTLATRPHPSAVNPREHPGSARSIWPEMSGNGSAVGMNGMGQQSV